MFGDECVRAVPLDRLVMGCSRGQDHRVRQSTLLAEPVIGLAFEVGDRVLGEEFGCDRAKRCFLGNGFRSVLAELGGLAMPGSLRPRTPRAVEAVTLVEPGERSGGPQGSHLLDSSLQ